MLNHTRVAVTADDPAADVKMSDWNAEHVVDADGLLMTSSAVTPTAPGAGNMILFSRILSGATLPAFIGPSGLASSLQPFIGRSKVALWGPCGGTATITGTFFGMVAPSTLGTPTSRSVATTSLFTSMQRVGYVSSGAINNRALAYGNATNYCRGNIANMGGFRLVARFGASDAAAVANANMFVGMAGGSSVGTGGTQPSAALNIVGVGADTGESTLCIMHNDGSGAATKVPLGANFPSNSMSTDIYELALFCAPNDTQIGWSVTRVNTGDTADGSITTDLPASTQLLLPIYMRGNNSTAAPVGIDIMGLYIEADN